MSSRERSLIGFMAVALSGLLVYAFAFRLVLPLLARRTANRALEIKNAELREQYEGRQSQNRKALAAFLPRSLPADLDLGKREYESLLGRLLTEAKVPSGFTLREKAPDGKGIPELAKNRPAYTKIAFTITMAKIDVGTLMAFLKRYYELDLLHQISSFTVKREDTSSIGPDRRQAKDRTDLNVTLVSEAIMLDGAPSRKTLFAAPVSAGAALGAPGLYTLDHTSPLLGRGIEPHSPVRILALPARDYAAVTTRDVLHGALPPPPPPPEKKKEKEPDPIPVGPDISPYIRLVSLVKSSDGTAHVELYDVWNNFDFEIDLTQKGEKLVATAMRFKKEKPSDANPTGRIPDAFFPEGGMLAFSDDKSSTKRLFKIYGIDGIALILGETDGKEPPKPAGGRFGSGAAGKGSKPPAPPDAKMAILGAICTSVPKVERFYRWEVGVPLKSIRELKADEAEKAIRRALGGLLEAVGTEPPALPPESETAPPPAAAPADGK